jgi:hypothetical protein
MKYGSALSISLLFVPSYFHSFGREAEIVLIKELNVAMIILTFLGVGGFG